MDTPAQTKTYQATVKKLSGSRVEITGVVPAEEFDAGRAKAVARIGKDIEMPGFRKGHVPEKMIVARFGDAVLLEEMAQIALEKAYPTIVTEEGLDPLGRPEIKITKVAAGNPLEFVAETDVYPVVTLPDFKKIAAKLNTKKVTVTVGDEEVTKTIEEIKKMRARADAEREGAPYDEKAPLPELTDEYVKSLGGDFASIGDFKAKLTENIRIEKTRSEKEKHRMAVLDAIVAETKLELPKTIVAGELERIEHEFARDISRMGMSFDDYLERIKKTKEEMRSTWTPDAEKRAKSQIVVAEIAKADTIAPTEEEMMAEIAKLQAAYPDADPSRLAGYVDMVLTNEKVLEMLETCANA
ncbi:MAG TPA: trigger factor [Candidatus Paceibacterota bacterium]|nr:trigger factor [Candidatus Paceibacterota bacterium]